MTQSPISTALQRNIAQLAPAIAVSCTPRRFFDLLVQHELVPYLSAVERIEVQGVSDYDKVSQLLSIVAVKLSNTQDAKVKVLQLMHIFKDLNPSLSDIAEKVVQDYRKSDPPYY